jgi:CubicO group peptidase (beta-lactamase class C family)
LFLAKGFAVVVCRSLMVRSIAFFVLIPIGTFACAEDPAAGSVAGKIKAAITPLVEKNELAGAVFLVATKDKVIALDAVGYADVAAKKSMPSDAMFWIASQSKPITGAAVAILIDEGKVKLDDPVEKFLPEFKGQKVKVAKEGAEPTLEALENSITVRHLLAHTSGMPFRSAIEVPTLDRYTLEKRVKSYAETPLDSQPGTKYQYSNAGINTAARIIEVVTGKSFEDFLDERLLKPLEMNDTTFWPNESQAKRIARAYTTGEGGQGLREREIEQLHYPLTDRTERFPMPAGGLFSTAADVAKFYQMLLNNGQWKGKQILSPEVVGALTSKQTPDSLKDGYGLGFSVGGPTFGHGGAYSTNSFADRDRGLILVWLVQHEKFPGEGGAAQGRFRDTAYEATK